MSSVDAPEEASRCRTWCTSSPSKVSYPPDTDAVSQTEISVSYTHLDVYKRQLLIFEMYIGRLGPVTFFLALAMRPTANRKEILPVGKIQIG